MVLLGLASVFIILKYGREKSSAKSVSDAQRHINYMQPRLEQAKGGPI